MKRFLTLFLIFFLLLVEKNAYAQICGTPGFDGSSPIGGQVNTYYPAAANTTLLAGDNSVMLTQVPADVNFNGGVNTYSRGQINVGDLLLIIQMQDATINSSDSNLYGAGIANSGADQLGGTGYLDLGNTGLFEYVVATNDVPLTGGNLTFRGTGANGGAQNSYFNKGFDINDTNRGQRTFQIVRVPQYSNVRLTATIYAPPFNGKAGGIIAFDVTGRMDMNGKTIDANARGFRGGFSFKDETDIQYLSTVYVAASTDTRFAGKGEGVVGSPKNMWDGFVQVADMIDAMPGGGAAKGAPGNGGGGGNDHNAGGGGGGNGGAGGNGGHGVTTDSFNSGGRPGAAVIIDPTLLMMGGGGGGGHVNNADLGDSGGVGGGIIVLNVGTIIGAGTITTNGGAGQSGGWCDGLNVGGIVRNCVTNDGGGGGGAGGTVFLKVFTPGAATLTINANGGIGGSTAEGGGGHGPGGGGGGGLIFYSIDSANPIINNVLEGACGKYDGNDNYGATDGTAGQVIPFRITDLPTYLHGGGPVCYPQLNTTMTEANTNGAHMEGGMATYTITISNRAGLGNAGGGVVDVLLPAGITYQSVSVSYTGGSGGNLAASVTTNQGTSNRPRFGNFVVASGGSVILTLLAKIDCEAASGTYNASAQVYYLDPTRDVDPLQRISPSPAVFAFPESLPVSLSYEAEGAVLGSNYDGLASIADNVVVIEPVPSLSSLLDAGVIQSGTLFSYTPTSDFIPPAGSGELSFTWSRSLVPGVSNLAATGSGNINEVLVNTTTAVKQVAYVYTPIINECSINAHSATVIVRVNPSDLTISASPTLVNAGNKSIITVSLPHSITAASTITFFLERSGNAVGGTHYVSSSVLASVTIPLGANSTSFTLQTLSLNTLDLSTELNLSGVLPNYSIHGCSVTIVDAATAERAIVINSGRVIEGNSIVLTASLSGSFKTFNPIVITLNSNPVFPLGYTIPSTITIPADGYAVSFTVQTVSDNRIGDSVFRMGGNATGFFVKEGILEVTDIDVQGVVLTIGSGSVIEGQSSTLTASLPLITSYSLTLILDHGVLPSGYSMPSSVVIPAGQSSVDFVFQTSRDNNVGDTMYTLTGSCSNISVKPGTVTVVDVDNQDGVTIAISSATIKEGTSALLSVSLPSSMRTNIDFLITIQVTPSFVDGYMINGIPGGGSESFTIVIPMGANSVQYEIFAVSDTDVYDNIYKLSGVDFGNYKFSSGTLTVKDLTFKKLNPANLITPNGDGYNDCWILDGIERYVDNEVAIFDRWGNTLYKIKDYDNASTTFCGTSNLGYGDFRSGSYYYVIKYKGSNSSESGTESGYITVLYDN